MKLQELKQALDHHLLSERENFYSVLRKAAETDAGLRRGLFLFASDMEKITSEVQTFFQKEEADPLGTEIPVEFRRISGMIRSRVAREENILMKAFEKWAGPRNA